MQWIVTQLPNGTYRIQNVDHHHSYANTEHAFWVNKEDSVVGGTDAQHWWIAEMPVKGNYWCVPHYNVHLLVLTKWM